ncbi:ankyrin repeat-containing protein ITN1-like [Momordica charantia]|uniref:Ankyrin repeat-containing protein ITN1-like n=1 Tax=Momordica charantia TaxID=3673 RepID=A0A6J1DJA0_MOMCH|nr:ankyrin repeat-containing protein ITN1-like [Momordica charantia]
MDPRLFQAVTRNQKRRFNKLVRQNFEIVKQISEETGNTALHLAVRHGRVELVKEILSLWPEAAEVENLKQETPFHEACREGEAQILRVLLDSPWGSSELIGRQNRNLLFLACTKSHVEVVDILLNHRRIHHSSFDRVAGFLEATSRGHLGVVQQILQKFPKAARKVDENGFSGLHNACLSGHVDVVEYLLGRDPFMARQFTYSGYTPLHLAAMNGKTQIIKVFLQRSRLSFFDHTKQGVPILHLTIRHNQFKTFLHCAQSSEKEGSLINSVDLDGNTILHVAAESGRVKFVKFLINEMRMMINRQNSEGLTPLDMLDNLAASDTKKFKILEDMLRNAGGKRKIELTNSTIPTSNKGELVREWVHSLDPNLLEEDGLQKIDLDRDEKEDEEIEHENLGSNNVIHAHDEQVDQAEKKYGYVLPNNLDKQKHLSQKRRKVLVSKMDGYRSQREKQHNMYKETLQNARNTITLVATLIATITFSVGINPPGGIHQDGPLIGKAVFAKTKGYKVFIISNSIALTTSLSIMIVLVSIIPFRRKLLLRLLKITHKVLWVSLAFMAMAFTSATWLTLPQDYKTNWLPNVILAVVGGTMGTFFIYLGVELVKHWMRKLKWRRERVEKPTISASNNFDGNSDHQSTDDQSSNKAKSDIEQRDLRKLYSFSTNSDVASSRGRGGHVY